MVVRWKIWNYRSWPPIVQRTYKIDVNHNRWAADWRLTISRRCGVVFSMVVFTSDRDVVSSFAWYRSTYDLRRIYGNISAHLRLLVTLFPCWNLFVIINDDTCKAECVYEGNTNIVMVQIWGKECRSPFSSEASWPLSPHLMSVDSVWILVAGYRRKAGFIS